MDTASLLWNLVLGSVGLGYFLYGKSQKSLVPALCGVVLMVFPYFISSTLLMVVVGAGLMAIPFFFRL